MNNINPVEILNKIEALPCGYCYQGGKEFEGAVELAIKALDFKEEIIRMANMGVYPEAIVEWVREQM